MRIEKLAQIILEPTVGDVMRHVSVDSSLTPAEQHSVKQMIVGTGLPVTQPYGRLANVAVGALGGNMLANYLGSNSFWKSMATVAGGLYGNMKYDRSVPDSHHAYGSNVYTY